MVPLLGLRVITKWACNLSVIGPYEGCECVLKLPTKTNNGNNNESILVPSDEPRLNGGFVWVSRSTWKIAPSLKE